MLRGGPYLNRSVCDLRAEIGEMLVQENVKLEAALQQLTKSLHEQVILWNAQADSFPQCLASQLDENANLEKRAQQFKERCDEMTKTNLSLVRRP